jgi:hypothetical protein
MSDAPTTALQIRSLVTTEATLELSLDTVEVPSPRDDQVLVRVEAAPINPSDLGLLFGAADMRGASFGGHPGPPRRHRPDPRRRHAGHGRPVGQALPVGNEGAGVVVAAGSSDDAQALLGATVAVLGGSMYSEYRCLPVAQQCLRLPDGVTSTEGASCFVNPLTALGMVETMRLEGAHRAGPHRGGIEPRPDARAARPGRRHRAGEHRAPARAGGTASLAGRRARVRLERVDVHRRPHRSAGRHRRHPRLRRHRWRSLAGRILSAWRRR